MSKRTKDLLGEMQDIFGSSFGDEEGEVLEEGKPQRGKSPQYDRQSSSKKQRAKKAAKRGREAKPHKGLVGGAQGKDYWVQKKRGEEQSKKARKDIDKEVAKHGERIQKKKEKEGKSRYADAMADIHGKMDKSKKDYDAKKDRAKKAKKAGTASPGGGGSRPERQQQSKTMGKKSPERHFPFKRSSDLGPGPRGKKHRETKCWSCKCLGNIYDSGCECTSTGKGKNCPPKFTKKQISYKPSYKRAYNREYHKWRAQQGSKVSQKLGARKTAL